MKRRLNYWKFHLPTSELITFYVAPFRREKEQTNHTQPQPRQVTAYARDAGYIFARR